VAAGGNGTLQGWIRLGFTVLVVLSSVFWMLAEIKSDLRELDARMSGRIERMSQHLDDLKAGADKEHDEMRRRISRLEREP